MRQRVVLSVLVFFASQALPWREARAEPPAEESPPPASQPASASLPASQPVKETFAVSAAVIEEPPESAPAPEMPPPPPSPPAPLSKEEARVAEALLEDIKHMVQVQQSGGWQIDRYEIEALLPGALESVCRVAPAVREAVLEEISKEILALQPAEEVWQKTKKLGKIKRQLFLDRVKKVLSEAHLRAESECPFYLTPDAGFRGLQSERNRVSFHAEGGGIVQLNQSGGSLTYGGGGTGRLLLGFGLSRVSFLIGGELAGGALLDTTSEEAGQLVVNYFAAVPVVLRLRRTNWHYEVELGPTAHLLANDLTPAFGSRVGVAVGVQSHRTRGVLPWAGLALAWDHYFPGVRERADFLRGGFRVGFIFN